MLNLAWLRDLFGPVVGVQANRVVRPVTGEVIATCKDALTAAAIAEVINSLVLSGADEDD